MADVSVVIPTHNRSGLVAQAIDSVLSQTDPAREVLVVDDGSTDDTEKQLASYGDRIRVIRQPQGGVAAARNQAFRLAVGEWIGFLDDDDVWLPTKLERQMMLIRLRPDLGLVHCSDYAVDDALKILYARTISPENRGDVFERLLMGNFIFQSCVMVRRDVLEGTGYMDPSLRFAPDWDLWLKITAKYSTDFVAEPLVFCRQSASGCLTRDIKLEQRLRETDRIFEMGITLRPIEAKVRRMARYELERRSAGSWLMEGSNDQALPHALRALSSRPTTFEGYRLVAYSLIPKRVRERLKALRKSGGS
jgi:Glycosyl transferase family 2